MGSGAPFARETRLCHVDLHGATTLLYKLRRAAVDVSRYQGGRGA